MPTKQDPSIVYDAFLKLPNQSQEVLLGFLEDYFAPQDIDLLDVDPVDWSPSPFFIDDISDQNLRYFGEAVNDIWKNLTKIFNHSQYCDTCYSSIEVPNPFVVAGGIFTEYYYWDSFWIIQGLLVSDMDETAKGMIMNFFHLVDTYGFVPNGGRVFYLNRSQPPVLTQIVQAYVSDTGDTDFLNIAVDYLHREHQFWMNKRSIELEVDGSTYILNHYNVNNTFPRPEAYMDDVNASIGMNSTQKDFFYRSVASACESGMDFSSRWFKEGIDFSTIGTIDVIPVDLNAILYQNEITIAGMYETLSNSSMSNYYTKLADQRLEAIHSVLWNEKLSVWTDYLLWNNSNRDSFYVTNYIPIWAGAYDANDAQAIYQGFRNTSVFHFPAGIPTSLLNSTEQWDFPNAWAPHMWFLIEGIDSMQIDDSSEFAFEIAQEWISTNYCGWKTTGRMFEKFDVQELGEEGKGGQYPPQAGFGWTNGVVLYYLQKYGQDLVAPLQCN